MTTRKETLTRLRDQVARGIPIIGAGAGTGISAKCEELGGADLIIIYNSGRFRMAGRGSIAGLMPYGDANQIVVEMAHRGVRRLLVACPSFVADCLETLEEVQMRLRDQFLQAGGEDLKLVPALNAEEHWVKNFCQMVGRRNLNWKNITCEVQASPNP